MITAVKNFNQKEIRPLSATMERGLKGNTFFRTQSNTVRSVPKTEYPFFKNVRSICAIIYLAMHIINRRHIGIFQKCHSRQNTTGDRFLWTFRISLCGSECLSVGFIPVRLHCYITVNMTTPA